MFDTRMSRIAFLLCVMLHFAFQIGSDMYTPIQTIRGVNSYAWKERQGVGRTDKNKRTGNQTSEYQQRTCILTHMKEWKNELKLKMIPKLVA